MHLKEKRKRGILDNLGRWVGEQTFKNSKGVQMFTHCASAFEAQKSFVTLHLVFPMLPKFLNSIKEWGRHEVFGVRKFSVL
jgi:hypothetical protein